MIPCNLSLHFVFIKDQCKYRPRKTCKNIQTREDSKWYVSSRFLRDYASSTSLRLYTGTLVSIDRIARDIRLIRQSVTGIHEIIAAKNRLDQGLPVELAALGFHCGYQPLISLPGGDRCHFLFRSVLDLFVRIAAGVNRSLGSLTHRLCIRYHL